MDNGENKELHKAIEEGRLELVKSLLLHSAEAQFSYHQTSALYKAFSCKMYDIASYLIHKGAKFEDSELEYLEELEIDLTRVNYLLLDYNKKSERWCIFRLLSCSQSPQGLDGRHLHALMSMYEDFFKSEIIKLIMMVLVESDAFDLVYDFESVDVNRIYRLNEEEFEIFGLTLSNSKEIFVGAKNLLSDDDRKRAKVYGVVAEELCHLALTTLFENNAKPYREEDSHLKQDFGNIVVAVKSFLSRSCHSESVIKDVFEDYNYREWESELIARVPHVIGIHGEELGRNILLESSELSRLLYFYERNVNPKCITYSEPSLNTKPHRIMRRLIKKNEFISCREKQIRPLKESFPSFGEYLVYEGGVSVITTSCTKLCTLQVYHELKSEYGDMLEKKCLFFASECFVSKRDEILDALKSNAWEYLILVVDDMELSLQKLTYEYFYRFDEFEKECIKIIIISCSHYLGHTFRNKAVKYKWSDLSDEYKHFRTCPIEYIFNGERQYISVKKEDVPKVFNERDINKIIGGELFEVCDGANLCSQGYNSATYIERLFQAITVDQSFFENLPPETSVLIYNFYESELKGIPIDKKLVQWLKCLDDQIQNDKSIFICNDKKAIRFENFVGKIQRKTNFCLYHDDKVFYVRNFKSSGNISNQHMKQISITEEEMMCWVRKNRIAIISDNAGCGKSTVTSSLIRNVKGNVYGSWVFRIDFSRFSTNERDPLSLANINQNSDDEELFDHLFLMLGLNNWLEKCRFRDFSSQRSCFVFFDGFDEISPKYKSKAAALLSTLRRKTIVNIVITTRRNLQEDLEGELNTFSHQLVPFDSLTQVSYLGKLWKWKLKFPYGNQAHTSQKGEKAVSRKIKNIIQELERNKFSSEHRDLIHELKNIDLEDSICSVRSYIDKLDFTDLAKNILKETLLDKETLEFMGIPLHLYMMGIIFVSGNFNVKIQSDVYCLYSQFIAQKILIYVEEKQGLRQEGIVKDEVVEAIGKNAWRIHSELADQLMDGEEVCFTSKMGEKDRQLYSALGIVSIHGNQVQFLHQTFGEFFMAESLRANMRKGVFVDILFEGKYNVVRRFLSSALEKKDFENLTIEFFQDVAFLITIMRHMMEYSFSKLYRSNMEVFCPFKIVKKLLKTFEVIDEKKSLVNKFTEGLHGLVIRTIGKRGDTFMYPMRIGVCLTLNMIRNLIGRNFMVNSTMILNFVKSSEEPREILDALQACFFCETADEHEKQQRGIKAEEIVRAEGLLEIMSIEDSDGKGLLYHALWNGTAEVFAYLLKLPRDVLGKDRFMKAIVQSYEYSFQMKKFMQNEHPRTICGLLKELQSLFGKEIDLLFDDDSSNKNWHGYIKSIDEMMHSIERIITLIEECYDIENLKEVLLNGNPKGERFTHRLNWFLLNRYFLKFAFVTTNSLCKDVQIAEDQFVEDILQDNGFLKQCLKNKGHYPGASLLYASSKDLYLEDQLRFYQSHLGKDELKKMLSNASVEGDNVIHKLACSNSSETLMKNLRLIEEIVGDEKWFKDILKSKRKSSENILHIASIRYTHLDELFRFCDNHLEKEEIRGMLIGTEDGADGVIHALVWKNTSETLFRNLMLIKEILGEDKWFQQFLKSRGQNCKNILYIATAECKYHDELLRFCGAHLDKQEIKKMLVSTDENGNNVIHLLAVKHAPEQLTKSLVLIKDTVGDDQWFKLLLKSKGQYSQNILHLASLKDVYLDELLKFYDSHLTKDEIKEMHTSTIAHGVNLIHLLVFLHSSETLMRNLEHIREISGDEEWFRQIVKSKSRPLQNIFHIASAECMSLEKLLQFCDTLLGKDEIKEMLLSSDTDGDNVIHLLVYRQSSEQLMTNLRLINYAVEDREWLKQFLKSKGQSLRNIFHFASLKHMHLDELLQFCCAHLQIDEVKEMLLSIDVDDFNVFHLLVLKNTSEFLMKNLRFIKEILGNNEWLKQLLKSKGQNCRNIFHLAIVECIPLDSLLAFCNAHLEKDEIKEMFISTDKHGYNVIQLLVWKHSSEQLTTNVRLVMEAVDDGDWMKHLLKSSIHNSRNIFHIASSECEKLDSLLQLCDTILTKDDIKQLLLSTDADGYNVIHILVLKHSIEQLMAILGRIKEIAADDVWFNDILRDRSQSSKNILHFALQRDMHLTPSLRRYEVDSEINEIIEVLDRAVACGINLLRRLESDTSSKTLKEDLSHIEDVRSIMDPLKKGDIQFTSVQCTYLAHLLLFCNSCLARDVIKEMLLTADKDGNNIIHLIVLSLSSEQYMSILRLIKNIFVECENLKDLLKSRNKVSKNIFHFAFQKGIILKELLQFCDYHLTKEEIKELLLTDEATGNITQLLVSNNSPENLVKNLNLIKETVADDKWFKKFLRSKGRNSGNIFHFASLKDVYLDVLLSFCDTCLEKDVIKDMFFTTDDKGCSVLHILALKNTSGNFTNNVRFIKHIVGDDEWFRRFLKNKGPHSGNMLHFACLKDLCLGELLQLCDSHLPKDDIKEMLITDEPFGINIIHLLASKNSPENLVMNLNLIKKTVADDKWFKKFLRSKGRNSVNIFHFAPLKNTYLDDLLLFCDALLEKNEMKDMLLCTDDNGYNVIHVLASGNTSANLTNNVSFIKHIVDDDEWFRRFLKSKGPHSGSILHFACLKDLCLGELLQLCDSHLPKDDIKEMLITDKPFGINIIQLLVSNNSQENLVMNLHLIKETVADEKWFKKLLKSKGRNSCNILHFASLNDVYLGELLQFCDSHLCKDDIKEMLINPEVSGFNVIHLLVSKNSPEQLVVNLTLIKETVADDQWFKQFLTSRGQYFENVFHFASIRDIHLDELLRFCNVYLDKMEIQEMMFSSLADGFNVVHLLVIENSSERFAKNLNLIKGYLGDNDRFKELLRSNTKNFSNIFHLAAQRDISLDVPLLYCVAHLEEDEVKEMLLSSDKDGDNIVHLSFLGSSCKTLNKNLNLIENFLGDHQRFEKLLKSKNRLSRNILHFAAENRKEIVVSALNSHLNEGEIAKLLTERDEEGKTCLHVASEICTMNVTSFFDCASEVLRFDRSRFEDLILGEDNTGDTFLHSLSKKFSVDNVSELIDGIFRSLRGKLSDELFKKLVRVRNKNGQTFLPFDENIRGEIRKYCKGILEESLFQELC